MADEKRDSQKIRHVSWREAERLAEKLWGRVSGSGYSFDTIIGVGRGGWVPARVISDISGVSRVFSVGVRLYKGVGKAARKPVITQLPPVKEYAGRRVLLVDDVADSGKSLKAALAILSKKADEVRVATLHFKPQSIVGPDFFAEETADWLVYPWERRETARGGKRKRVLRKL